MSEPYAKSLFFIALFFQLICLNCVLAGELNLKTITLESLDERIKANDKLLVLFYDNGCKSETCQEASQAMETLWQASYPNLELVAVESEAQVKQYDLKVLPQVVFFRKSFPVLYHSAAYEADDMYQFVSTHSDILSRRLADDNFEHDTQAASGATTGDWLILFYKPSCSEQFATWEAVASRLQQRVVFGHVDLESTPAVDARFKFSKCPTVLYFRHGKSYLYEAEEWSVESLVEFAESGYQKYLGIPVPPETSSMDGLVATVFQSLMDKLMGGYNKFILAGCVTLVITVIIIIAAFSTKKRRSHLD